MYFVYCDGHPIYDLRDETLILETPIVKLTQNSAGTFEFTIHPKHPRYNYIQELQSIISVYDGEDEIFCGRVVEVKRDRLNKKQVFCEGELAFFNDSIQRPEEYQGVTLISFLTSLIANHNQQVETQSGVDKTFTLGAVTVTDPNNYVYKYTNWESTLEVIKKDLLETYGGYLRIRKSGGVRYLDYLKDYPNTNTQVINFGENLLDFTEDMIASDIATAVVPIGAIIEHTDEGEESETSVLEERLTIVDVNDGVDFVYSESAVETYGWIFKIVIWDDVHIAENLKRKGEEYLSEAQFKHIHLEVGAIDLHMMDVEIERIKLLDKIRILSKPNGLDSYFPVTEMTIQIDKPSNNTVTLGLAPSEKHSLTTQTSSASQEVLDRIKDIPKGSDILAEAKRNATELIKSATNGHVYITEGAEELLIMDTDDPDTATKVWKWNLNGLGYSSDGYEGTYGLAMTMDGQIVGDRLVAGSVQASALDSTYKTSVEEKISDAYDDAKDYTNQSLLPYWTRSEVETAIRNTGDAVLLSAKEEAKTYTDGQLLSYATKAEVQVTADAITSEVNKKVNDSDFSTKIQQNATSVRIAWNNISKYIQFENGELRIYDSTNESTQQLVAKFNYTGSHYYGQGKYLGHLGATYLTTNHDYKGLAFELKYDAGFICWSAEKAQDSTSYNIKLIYYNHDYEGLNLQGETYTRKQGLHFECPTYTHNNLYLNDNTRFWVYTNGEVGLNGKLRMVNDENTKTLFLFNANDRSVEFWTNIDMHYWSIINQSDARMKTNIEPTDVNALEILNSFDMKQFDWIENNEHEKIGIIAQQLQLIEPDLVQQEADGHLSIKTTKFIYYIIKAIQELCEEKGYVKTPWDDPYTLQDKLVFCKKLNSGDKQPTPVEETPIQLPKRK